MMNYKNQLINVATSAILIFFSLPKLLGKPQSIAGFEQFEKVLHIDADIFRVFTGVVELGLAMLLTLAIFNKNSLLGKIAFSFVLITMLTALILEFFARPEPKAILVFIAFVLAFLSLYRLKQLNNPLNEKQYELTR